MENLLVECLKVEGPKHVFVEVKSHLKHILVAELTDGETKFAEMRPLDYVVCNVMNLENKNLEPPCRVKGKIKRGYERELNHFFSSL